MTPTSPVRSDRSAPLFVFAVTWVLFFWRYGYAYATGDHDELLPLLFHLMDPDVLATDWFVQTQVEQFSVRTYFVWLLRVLCYIMPPWLAIAVVYGGLWMWIANGIYRLALELVPSRLGAVGAVVASLAVVHKWTLGGNDVVYTMLAAEMLAWALVLPALRLFLNKRYLASALLLGVATWFQLLAGLLTVGVLGLILLWDRVEMKRIVGFSAAFLVAGLPALAPILLQQLQAQTLAAEPSVFYILGPFRNPFHHMAFSFETSEWIKFTSLLALGLGSLFMLWDTLAVERRRFILQMTGIVLILCAITVVFTEGIPVLIVAKFQSYKLTVLVKIVMMILIAGLIARYLPEFLEVLLDYRWMGCTVTILLVALTITTAFPKPKSDLQQAESWIQASTPVDAVFAVPPSIGSFRSRARRGIVINYGAFPFSDALMQDWYTRLLDIAPIDPPRRGLGIKPVLDEAYHEHTAEDWHRLAARYGITHLLIDTRLQHPALPFDELARFGPWAIMQLTGATS